MNKEQATILFNSNLHQISRKDPILYNSIKDLTNYLPEKSGVKQRLWHIINGPHIPFCSCCERVQVKWNTAISQYREFCSVRCMRNSEKYKEKVKKTNLERYGTEIPQQTKEVKEKSKRTNLERYGVEQHTQNENIKEKKVKTNLERYGVENVFQNKEVQEKQHQTNLERYGVKYTCQISGFYDRVKLTNLERYGVENVFQNKEIRRKIRNTNLERYGVEYPGQCQEIHEKQKLTNLERYGVENVFANKETQKKIKQTKLKKYGTEHIKQIHISSQTLEKLDNYKWLYNQHINLQKSLSQISKELNVSDVTIGNYLRKHKIETQLYSIGFLCERYFRNNPEVKLEDASLYILQMNNENESFLKIGITTTPLEKRYSNVPYNIEPLVELLLPLYSAWLIEQETLKTFKEQMYIPTIEFGGKTECLQLECLEQVLLFIKDVLF